MIRDIDIPARLGGDEFALLLPSTGLDQAVRIAERIRRIVGGAPGHLKPGGWLLFEHGH